MYPYETKHVQAKHVKLRLINNDTNIDCLKVHQNSAMI